MKEFFAKRAAVIGAVSTATFAIVMIWYAPQSSLPVPQIIYWIGGVAIVLMLISLWSSMY